MSITRECFVEMLLEARKQFIDNPKNKQPNTAYVSDGYKSLFEGIDSFDEKNLFGMKIKFTGTYGLNQFYIRHIEE